MKIAITSKENSLKSCIDTRFGRANGFIIYDLGTEKHHYIENSQNFSASQGAGIQAAQTVINSSIDAVITGHCGPKAFRVLTEAGVKIFLAPEDTILNVIEKFKNDELKQAITSDVEGHW